LRCLEDRGDGYFCELYAIFLGVEGGAPDLAALEICPLDVKRLAIFLCPSEEVEIKAGRVLDRVEREECVWDTCDVESAGFIVCRESPDSVAQLRRQLREDCEHNFGFLHY
jgi:hypothetical protein